MGADTSKADLGLFIDDLLVRTDIVHHIREFIKLEKAGDRYKGLCPFHDEKTPSFTVNADEGLYYCFGCTEGGNIITFYKNYKKLNFWEALIEISGKEGIQLPGKEFKKEKKRRTILEDAADFYHSQVRAEEAWKYLTKKRKISPEAITDWKIGFAPNEWDALKNHMTKKGYTVEELKLEGILRESERGTYYDYFRGRIIFPINDHAGRLAGFGGRDITGETDIKYSNSPGETGTTKTFYNKERILFGLDKASKWIKQENEAILTEGYTDVISAHSTEIKNTVATCGTAFTDKQAALIKRYADNILIMMDADNAGIKAAKKAAQVAFGEGLNPRFGLLPEGTDLDEIVKQYGEKSKVMQEINVMNIPEFFSMTAGPWSSAEEKYSLMKEIGWLFSAEKDTARRIIYTKEVADKLSVPVEAAEAACLNALGIKKNGLISENKGVIEHHALMYVANLLMVPAQYARPFFEEIPPESSAFSKPLAEVYRIIIADYSSENRVVQEHLGIVYNSKGQADMFKVKNMENAFDYIKKKFCEQKLQDFPAEISDTLARRVRVDIDMHANVLKTWARREQQGILMGEISDAVQKGNRAYADTLSEKLIQGMMK